MSLLLRSLVFCAISVCPFAQGNEPFAFIEKAVQDQRDLDRRDILETELLAEERALGNARQVLKRTGDDDTRAVAHRHEENVKALQRELARIPGETAVHVAARRVVPDQPAIAKRVSETTSAPFWDAYRRTAPSTDLQPLAKELP